MVRELEVIEKYDNGRSSDFLLHHLPLLILTRSACRVALKYASSWTLKTLCVKKGPTAARSKAQVEKG